MAQDRVEPVVRAFAVLEALNRPTGSVALAAVAEATKLPKPTVARLLSTLEGAGYVHRLPKRRGYTLSERVLRLSSGFRHADAVVEAARPFLSALTAEHRWPVALATLDHDAMRVRLSTRQESPFSTDPDLVDRRTPMLVSALGRAYLAFCPDAEREAIVALLRASPRRENVLARDARAVRGLIRSIRQHGYAETAPVPGDPARGLAVPIAADGRVLAAMTLRYLSAAVTKPEAVGRYLPSLKQAAIRIVAAHEAAKSVYEAGATP